MTPIPKPRQRGRARGGQQQFVIDEGIGLSTQEQQYDVTAAVNEIRRHVDQWRNIPGPNNWGVTPETARLLLHWRQHNFSNYRPFFCQVEAVETLIWLTEVAPRLSPAERRVLDRLVDVNQEANPELSRIALKLATGAGKTTVMAMIIAWQTINAVRHPNSRRFTRGFLVVTPGLTIKDRLRVLQPNDPDSYYASRELVPGEMLEDLQRAKIVITNYHALRLRERLEVSSGGRALLQGPGQPLETLETEGQMIQRVMPELMAMKNVMALNDEGHHCYRRKPGEEDERPLTAEERQEATKNSEEARDVDFRPGDSQPEAGRPSGGGPVGHSFLPPRLRLCRRNPFPLDGERLFPDGRHRMRDRQAAPGPGSRQHPRGAGAGLSQPMGAYPGPYAPRRKKPDRQPGPTRPAHYAANGPGSSLRALQNNLRAVGSGRNNGAALLHCRLQQYFDFQAGV